MNLKALAEIIKFDWNYTITLKLIYPSKFKLSNELISFSSLITKALYKNSMNIKLTKYFQSSYYLT